MYFFVLFCCVHVFFPLIYFLFILLICLSVALPYSIVVLYITP